MVVMTTSSISWAAELFYSVGSPELAEARKLIADFSFKVRRMSLRVLSSGFILMMMIMMMIPLCHYPKWFVESAEEVGDFEEEKRCLLTWAEQ